MLLTGAHGADCPLSVDVGLEGPVGSSVLLLVLLRVAGLQVAREQDLGADGRIQFGLEGALLVDHFLVHARLAFLALLAVAVEKLEARSLSNAHSRASTVKFR